MFFIAAIVSRILNGDGDGQHRNPAYGTYYPGQAQPQFSHKSCRQLKQERRIARQTRRTEKWAARSEKRAARTERRKGCCGGMANRRDLRAGYIGGGNHLLVDASPRQAAEGHQQIRGIAEHSNLGHESNNINDINNQEQRTGSAEWNPQSVPDEAPPSYEEVVVKT